MVESSFLPTRASTLKVRVMIGEVWRFNVSCTSFCDAPLLKYVIPSFVSGWLWQLWWYKMMTIPIADSQSGSEHFSTFCYSEVCGEFLRKRKQISIKGEETSINKLPVVNFISACGCVLLTFWSWDSFVVGNNSTITMRFLYVLSLAGLASAGVQTVKREADPVADAEADPQLLSGHKPIAVSAPECHSVPELKCAPRQVSEGIIENHCVKCVGRLRPQGRFVMRSMMKL